MVIYCLCAFHITITSMNILFLICNTHIARAPVGTHAYTTTEHKRIQRPDTAFISVRTILVLGYRVLANTGRYWGGLGIGRYFIDCKTRYRLPLTPLSLSKPQSNSIRRRAAATIGLQRSRFASKQQWQGEWGGVGAPVERSPFMRDWKN